MVRLFDTVEGAEKGARVLRALGKQIASGSGNITEDAEAFFDQMIARPELAALMVEVVLSTSATFNELPAEAQLAEPLSLVPQDLLDAFSHFEEQLPRQLRDWFHAQGEHHLGGMGGDKSPEQSNAEQWARETPRRYVFLALQGSMSGNEIGRRFGRTPREKEGVPKWVYTAPPTWRLAEATDLIVLAHRGLLGDTPCMSPQYIADRVYEVSTGGENVLWDGETIMHQRADTEVEAGMRVLAIAQGDCR